MMDAVRKVRKMNNKDVKKRLRTVEEDLPDMGNYLKDTTKVGSPDMCGGVCIGKRAVMSSMLPKIRTNC